MQSEYNWTDDVVLDLPVCRLRQIIANIEARKKATRQHHTTITEWQTRTLAQFIAATIPVEKGKKNPVADAAAKLSLRIEDETGNSDDDTPMEKYLEEGSQTADNGTGSFERLTAGFGGAPS